MNNIIINYFKQIASIPRESGNEKQISDFIVRFAKERNLEYYQDSNNNVIIRKIVDDKEPIILQAHLDMVCVKENDIVFDFKKDGIEVIQDNNLIHANHTTLGADNGIGVAEILNILDNTNISIEAIFTTEEETTMNGAETIDLSPITGHTMINLDGFEENTILLECASFTDIEIKMNYQLKDKLDKNIYRINLRGLPGGHSGADIDKNNGNSIIMLSKLLSKIESVRICDFTSGTRNNVIPSTATAVIQTDNQIENIINDILESEKTNYPNFQITLEKISGSHLFLSVEDSSNLINSLLIIPHGVFNKNHRNEVTTSENLAVISLKDNLLLIGLRSSIEEERKEVLNNLSSICKNNNYQLNITGYQPGFRSEENSKLIQDLIQAYRKVNKKEPRLESKHVALEVGLIKEKIPNLEVAVISPKIIGAHTTKESVDIDSINKWDEWLRKFLNNN